MGLDSSNWCLDAAGSATSTPADGLQAVPRQWSGAGSLVQPFGDDASPISSSSRFVNLQAAGSLTPSSVESGRLFADSNSQQQQQQQLHQQQLARLLAVQRQQQEARKQLVQAPQQRQQLPAQLGFVPSTAAQKQGAVQWTWQQQPQVLLLQQQQQTQQQQVALLPQSSGSSFSSSGSLTSSGLAYGTGSDSFTSNPAITSATTTAWQQLLRHQQLQLQQQQGQQVVQFIPAAARTLQSVGSTGTQLVKRLAAPISLDQQPAAKKAATQAAVNALLQGQAAATAAWRAAAPPPQAAITQQQLVLLPAVPSSRQTARLPPTGLLRTRQQQQQVATGHLVTLVSAPSLAAASAGIAVPMRVLEPAQQKLLQWAGRVLNCQLQDAYLLGTHLYQRVTGQLDDMLLISLGVTVSTESVTMLVSLWVASKLEGHRRQVAGASKLAAALQLLPSSITDIELHVMQRLSWQPYAGWAARSF